MQKIIPRNYISHNKSICDWTDKKKYLIHYRVLKFYVRHGMLLDNVHDVISFKQSKWLEKYIIFNTQKRNQAVNDFEKDFYKLLNNAFYGKTMENVRNRCTIDFNKKDEVDKIIKEQFNKHSMVFVSHMIFVIVTLSNKLKFQWIRRCI